MMPKLRALRQWQCKRLLASHDQHYQVPKFKAAMDFFVEELYGPKDFSQRDQDIARVVPKMAKLLPNKALATIEIASHLNYLSLQLDCAMLPHLPDTIDTDTYAKAYVACKNPKPRAEQIKVIEQLGLDLARVVAIPGISTLLMLARKPAKLAGLDALQVFLETGFAAFRKLGDVDAFLMPMVSKEQALMEQLFAGENPLPLVQ